jgi:subtilisin family serine protease
MSKAVRTIICLALSFIAFQESHFSAQAPNANANAGVGRVLVRFRPAVNAERVRALLDQVGAQEEGEIAEIRVRVLRVSRNAEQAVVRALSNREEVEFAEVDALVEPDRVPNDTHYPSQWHLTQISGPTAWDSEIGDNSLTIAILDTGVDSSHPDLGPRIVPGRNIFNNNSDTADVHGHGTAVAGTAAAVADNGAGVGSVCWYCRIMPIRISDAQGWATYSNAASGLTWAANNGARVANISYRMSNSLTVRNAAQYFQSLGGVVTSSSGNDGILDTTADNPYILTVGATGSSDGITSWSNTGNNVDVTAPGESILTTMTGNRYGWWSGTSFSAPITAGVAALVKSANPDLTGAQVLDIVRSSADDLGAPGWDATYGMGRVNAAAAIALALDTAGDPGDTTRPTISIVSPAAGATVSGQITIQVSASDASGIASVRLDSPAVATDTSSPYTFPLNTTTLSNGPQTIMATATDMAGNSQTTSITVTVANVVDTIDPVPTIAMPLDRAVVSGNITIAATATDNILVTRMELWIDSTLKATSSSSTLSTKWNTKPVARGQHILRVRAFDAAGNVGTTEITVTR